MSRFRPTQALITLTIILWDVISCFCPDQTDTSTYFSIKSNQLYTWTNRYRGSSTVSSLQLQGFLSSSQFLERFFDETWNKQVARGILLFQFNESELMFKVIFSLSEMHCQFLLTVRGQQFKHLLLNYSMNQYGYYIQAVFCNCQSETAPLMGLRIVFLNTLHTFGSMTC